MATRVAKALVEYGTPLEISSVSEKLQQVDFISFTSTSDASPVTVDIFSTTSDATNFPNAEILLHSFKVPNQSTVIFNKDNFPLGDANSYSFGNHASDNRLFVRNNTTRRLVVHYSVTDVGVSTDYTTEQLQDIVGAMVDGGTETNIAVTYDDTAGKLNFVSVDTDTNTQLTLIDSDTMSGALATNVASAESIKAYVDGAVIANTDTQDLSIVGQTLSLTNGGSVTLPDTNTQLDNAGVIGKVLTGIDVSTTADVVAADTIVAAIGKLENRVATNDDKVSFPGLGTSNSTALAGDTTTITTGQASAITANTTKTTNATHTGDVTGSGALTIANDAVTYAKMQNVSATNVVLGRDSAGAGVVEEISAANLRTILNVADGATADQTNVTGSSGSCTGNSATATALTAGDKTIDGSLDIGSNQAGHDLNLYGANLNNAAAGWVASANLFKFTDSTKLGFGTANQPGAVDSFIQANGNNLVISNTVGNIQIGDTVEITGDLDVTGNVLPGITYVKILPSDFVPDDVGRPAMIDDTSSDRWLESHGTAKLFAYVDIPVGFKATHVDVYGSGTSAVTVYEADIDSKTVTSKGTGNIQTQIDITDVTADATNYLLIELAQTSSEEVYGGKITIAKA